MSRTLLVLMLVAGLMALFVGYGSALWTSTATVDANTFTTGTLQLTTSPTTALVTFSNMAPGDKVTAPITVTNSGTLDLRYAITDSVTNADSKGLGAELTLAIKSGVTTCTNGGFGTDGTSLYNNVLGSLGSTLNVVGDPTPGAQAGDRTLAASNSEVLCFQVMLPTNASSSYQGATTTATFNFVGEQTANNP